MSDEVQKITESMSGVRMGTEYKDKCVEFLKENKISEGTTEIENRPKQADHSNVQSLRIRTNMFPAVNQPIDVYQYDVKMRGRNPRANKDWQEISIVAANDYLNMERREACGFLFTAVRKQVSEIKEAKFAFYYNRRSILYTTKKLQNSENVFTFSRKDLVELAEVDQTNATQMAVFRNFDEFLVEIKKAIPLNMQNFNTDISSLAAKTNAENVNPEFIQFLDIVASQSVMEDRESYISFTNSVSYFADPEAHGFQQKDLMLDNGIYFAPGISKSARFIAQSQRKVASAIVVEPKISPFHSIQTVAQKVEGIKDQTTMLNLIRGLFVYPAHLFHRSQGVPKLKPFKIVGLGDFPDNIRFENRDGNQQSVTEYFMSAHSFRLEHTELPTIQVEQKSTGEKMYYPMEVCEILDNQRLSTAAMKRDIIDKLIKTCAVPPFTLDKRIQNCAKSLNFSNSNYLKEAQIEINSKPIEFDAPVLDGPRIIFSNNTPATFDAKSSQWPTRNTRYTKTPHGEKKWAAYSVIRGGISFQQRELDQFVTEFLRTCNQKGMGLYEPLECFVLSEENRRGEANLPQLRDRIKSASAAGCKFILVITQREDVLIHASLKAYEQEFGVVTQNISRAKACEAAGINTQRKVMTMENMVNKTNMKMGGLNYTLEPSNGIELKKTDLIVGICINHVAGGRGDLEQGEALAPSVIGYSANDGLETSKFIGDFVYQPASRGVDLKAFTRVLNDVFGRYLGFHSMSPPNRVILYRNGVAEGDYAQVLKYEIPTIRRAIELNFGQKIPFTLIVCTRLHNGRFYPKIVEFKDKPREQNMPAGVVIDSSVVHPNIPEFYLSTHRAIQGTSKIPRYAVLYNEAKMDMDEIQGLSHVLAFAHQIINMPVSVPSPVYIAEQYAKRGRNLYNAKVNDNRILTTNRDPHKLTDVLGYKNLEIREHRVNA